MGFTSYSVDNDRAFSKAVRRAAREVGDLRLPLTLITQDFYKSNKAIWKLKGPGQYPDLAQSTKDRKEAAGKPIYPILQFTGRLRDSMTKASHSDALHQIINRRTLILGTKVDYGKFHQSDILPRTRLPQRKFLFLGPESSRGVPIKADKDKEGRGRLERWTSILGAHVAAVTKKRIG